MHIKITNAPQELNPCAQANQKVKHRAIERARENKKRIFLTNETKSYKRIEPNLTKGYFILTNDNVFEAAKPDFCNNMKILTAVHAVNKKGRQNIPSRASFLGQ